MFETVPMDKIGVTNERQTNLEYLGTDMIEGGNEFGVGTPYGISSGALQGLYMQQADLDADFPQKMFLSVFSV